MQSPKITVVIPTKDRESRLAFALDGLAAQTLPAESFEVIVVRQSEGGRLTSPPAGLRCRLAVCPDANGAGAQRNTGWRLAESELVAFMDDDVRPRPDWLERLLEARDGDDAILQGRTEPDPDEALLLHGLARSIMIDGPSAWFETCNIAYPKALLERLDGFDEQFPRAWGEDTDLGLRAVAAGARLRYVEAALVYHAVNPRSLPRALRDATQRDNLPIVIATHPHQRAKLDRHLFVRKAHGPLLLALAGGLVFRRRPALALACTAPYLNRYLDTRRGWLRGAVRLAIHLPVRVPVDLVEIAALARQSVRQRTLVL